MPSKALQDFENRLEEVKQLMEAHGALTRLRRAEAALQSSGKNLQDIAQVVQHLVSSPGRGRPAEVHTLNSAAIALLSAHLQGFIVDIFKEVSGKILDGKVEDIEVIHATVNTRGNPNEYNIVRLFKVIGFSDVLDGVSWQRMSNKQLRNKLQKFNQLRNRIVHGASEHVNKWAVENYQSVFTNLAHHMDSVLREKVRALTGRYPWGHRA